MPAQSARCCSCPPARRPSDNRRCRASARWSGYPRPAPAEGERQSSPGRAPGRKPQRAAGGADGLSCVLSFGPILARSPGPRPPSAPVLALFDDDSRVLMTEPDDLAQHLVRLVDSGDRPEADTIEFLRAELNRDHAGIADEASQLLAQMLRIADLQERAGLDEDVGRMHRCLHDG